MMNKWILLLILGIFMVSCKSKSGQAENREIIAMADDHPGKKIVVTTCLVCHNPNQSIENRVAPPMVGVQKHYLDFTNSKEEFINDMVDFMRKPAVEKSKMPGAVKRFGLMPIQNFSEEDIRNAAEYIYHADLEEPDWFKVHYAESHPDQSNLTPQERGAFYAQTTKAVLGSNLLNAINTKGPDGAVTFCNTRAIPLTDSMAVVNHATIQRVSDKPRNPDNRANEDEITIINQFKELLAAGEKTIPVVKEGEERTHFYAPIVTNDMCLKCHGSIDGTITPPTIAAIRDLYPNDEATGYETNQVRGMWKISWSNDPVDDASH